MELYLEMFKNWVKSLIKVVTNQKGIEHRQSEALEEGGLFTLLLLLAFATVNAFNTGLNKYK